MNNIRIWILVGLFGVFAAVGWVLYSNRESLPPTPTTHFTKQDETRNASKPKQSEFTETPQAPAPIATNSDEKEPAVTKTATDKLADEPDDPEPVPEPENEKGMSQAEIKAVVERAFSFQFTDFDEMKAQLEGVLTGRFGDDARIPRFLNNWKTIYIILKTIKDDSYSAKGNEEQVNRVLEQLPAIAMRDMIEISLDLFNPPAEKAAELRAIARGIEESIDSLEIAQEARPLVETAIREGNLTPEEGTAFIKAVSGLDSKFVPDE